MQLKGPVSKFNTPKPFPVLQQYMTMLLPKFIICNFLWSSDVVSNFTFSNRNLNLKDAILRYLNFLIDEPVHFVTFRPGQEDKIYEFWNDK